MPRDPKDISIMANERTQRRIGELDDGKDPLRLRVGAGPAGAEGKEGPKGEKGEKGATGTAGTNGTNGENGKEGPAGSAENIDWKNSVRVATTANITIATALNNGDALDGITLATNDRVLVKDQTTKKENGIWIVGVTPARALDADAAGELSGGVTVHVEQGTRNARRNFQINTVGPITPGTTEHTWVALTPKDFGLVSALPTSEAVAGDCCTYKADNTNGVFWQLIYDGEGEFPWKKVGGPPLRSQYTAAEKLSTTSVTPQLTNAPSVTAPLKMEFNTAFGTNLSVNGGASQARMRLFIGGTEQTGNADWTSMGGADAVNTIIGPLSGRNTKTATAAQAIQARYYSNTAGKTAEFYAPYVEIDPIRVG